MPAPAQQSDFACAVGSDLPVPQIRTYSLALNSKYYLGSISMHRHWNWQMIISLQLSWQIQIWINLFTSGLYYGQIQDIWLMMDWNHFSVKIELHKWWARVNHLVIWKWGCRMQLLYTRYGIHFLHVVTDTCTCQQCYPYGVEKQSSPLGKTKLGRSRDTQSPRKLALRSRVCASIHIVADRLRLFPWYLNTCTKVQVILSALNSDILMLDVVIVSS